MRRFSFLCHVVFASVVALGCSSDDPVGPLDPVATVWDRTAGGTLSDQGLAITADGSGNVIVAGTFQGRPDFAGTTLTGVPSTSVCSSTAAGQTMLGGSTPHKDGCAVAY